MNFKQLTLLQNWKRKEMKKKYLLVSFLFRWVEWKTLALLPKQSKNRRKVNSIFFSKNWNVYLLFVICAICAWMIVSFVFYSFFQRTKFRERFYQLSFT
jgi:hypothetical protein